jgi:hypothetical protein
MRNDARKERKEEGGNEAKLVRMYQYRYIVDRHQLFFHIH